MTPLEVGWHTSPLVEPGPRGGAARGRRIGLDTHRGPAMLDTTPREKGPEMNATTIHASGVEAGDLLIADNYETHVSSTSRTPITAIDGLPADMISIEGINEPYAGYPVPRIFAYGADEKVTVLR